MFTKSGLKLYGGFDGTETQLSDRDFQNNKTILSGDLMDNDDNNLTFNNSTRTDNAYRVTVVEKTTATTISIKDTKTGLIWVLREISSAQKKGDKVSKGSQIGQVGINGHIHLEVQKGGHYKALCGALASKKQVLQNSVCPIQAFFESN